MTTAWQPDAATVFAASPIIPVLVIEKPEHGLPIAEALIRGGIRVLEITLRTPAALDIIQTLSERFPELMIGAGTVTNARQFQQAVAAGSRFIISPGLTPALLETACTGTVPLIPGVSTISDIMLGMEYGLDHFKFFPAEASGGIKALQAFAGPLPDIRFCPTGGINPGNAADYLNLPNVACVGGSWLVTKAIVDQADWPAITRLSRNILDTLT